MQKKAVTSNSFVQNVFRGMIEPTQVFPFPVALDEEQRENLEMLVHIAERLLEATTWEWESSSAPTSQLASRESCWLAPLSRRSSTCPSLPQENSLPPLP